MFLFFKSILIIVSIDEVKVGVSRLRKLWFIVRFVFLASVCRSSPESSSAEEDQPCSQEAKEDQTNSHPNPLGFPGKGSSVLCLLLPTSSIPSYRCAGVSSKPPRFVCIGKIRGNLVQLLSKIVDSCPLDGRTAGHLGNPFQVHAQLGKGAGKA